MGASGDLLQIGAADTAGMYADKQLARANLRHSNGLKANISYGAVDHSLHSCRDGLVVLSLGLNCNSHLAG
jgi:hypothetical protein